MGDKNLKLFHKKASLREKINEVTIIVDLNGVSTEEISTIEETFLSYFENLFSSSNSNPLNINQALDVIIPKVNQSMNTKLMAPFTKSEVKRLSIKCFLRKLLAPMVIRLFFTKNIDIL